MFNVTEGGGLPQEMTWGIRLDQAVQGLLIIGFVVNLFDLVAKTALKGYKYYNQMEKLNTPYYHYLDQKKYVECLQGMIPVYNILLRKQIDKANLTTNSGIVEMISISPLKMISISPLIQQQKKSILDSLERCLSLRMKSYEGLFSRVLKPIQKESNFLTDQLREDDSFLFKLDSHLSKKANKPLGSFMKEILAALGVFESEIPSRILSVKENFHPGIEYVQLDVLDHIKEGAPEFIKGHVMKSISRLQLPREEEEDLTKRIWNDENFLLKVAEKSYGSALEVVDPNAISNLVRKTVEERSLDWEPQLFLIKQRIMRPIELISSETPFKQVVRKSIKEPFEMLAELQKLPGPLVELKELLQKDTAFLFALDVLMSHQEGKECLGSFVKGLLVALNISENEALGKMKEIQEHLHLDILNHLQEGNFSVDATVDESIARLNLSKKEAVYLKKHLLKDEDFLVKVAKKIYGSSLDVVAPEFVLDLAKRTVETDENLSKEMRRKVWEEKGVLGALKEDLLENAKDKGLSTVELVVESVTVFRYLPGTIQELNSLLAEDTKFLDEIAAIVLVNSKKPAKKKRLSVRFLVDWEEPLSFIKDYLLREVTKGKWSTVEVVFEELSKLSLNLPGTMEELKRLLKEDTEFLEKLTVSVSNVNEKFAKETRIRDWKEPLEFVKDYLLREVTKGKWSTVEVVFEELSKLSLNLPGTMEELKSLLKEDREFLEKLTVSVSNVNGKLAKEKQSRDRKEAVSSVRAAFFGKK